jgi:hypothetical protein
MSSLHEAMYPNTWSIFDALVPVLFFLLCAFLSMAGIEWYVGHKKIPAALDRLSERIVKGKVPAHINLVLKDRVPGYLEHYKMVPGRMSCRVAPYKCGEPDIYMLVVGFKEHVRKPADKFINIPVYKNGKLYE